MRITLASCATALALLPATPAAAGPGDPFNGIDISIIDKSTGSAVVWSLPSSSTSNDVEDDLFILASGELSGSQTRPVTGIGGTTATRISWSNAAATIQPGSPVSMSLLGSWQLLGFGGATIASLPLNVIGSGGTTALTTPFALTLRGYGWTTGFATITGLTNPIGGTPFTITTAGSDARTLNGLGTVSWVSPVVINTPLGSETHVLQLDVTYVPEPAVGLTAGLGLLCLGLCGWLGRRRDAAP